MSTVIYQGLQPCLDSQLIEKTTLKLKIVEPKSPPQIFPKKIFLDEEMEFSKPFPPLRLSEKSLELCTESLGSESGSDTSEGFDFETEKMLFENEQRNFNFRPLKEIKKSNPREFPPPLTTISGSNSLQVRPHREAGRLVIKAIHAPTFGSYFQAERSHGRLRLTMFKNLESKFDPMASQTENNKNVFNVEIQEDQEEENVIHEEGDEEEEESVIYEEGYEEGDEEEEEVYEEEYDQCEGGEVEEYYEREDLNANMIDVGVEMGIEKFQRPSRCIEEGGQRDKGWCCWEAIWVATS